MNEGEQAALAFVKLQDDVQELIVKAVTNELITNPSGTLAMQLSYITRHIMQEDMRQYRIVKAGEYAQY